MAPFTHRSNALDVFMPVVNNDFLNDDFLHTIESLPKEEDISVPLPEAISQDEYFAHLDGLIRDIHSGILRKAIISRVFYEKKPQDFHPVDFFERLSDAFPATFVHLSQHPESGVWAGATPELLLKKRDHQLSIMALAGTQARKEDHNYEWRNKEMEEHLMVGEHIEETFRRFDCTLTIKDGPHTIESGRVAHLSTDYAFEEKNGLPLQQFLSELHPTPAVGGLPVDSGVDAILKHEGYDRRYYCGFIGETDFDQTADLYINLRCVQIGKENIAVYVGGGITAASDPQEEWQETVMKSKTMLENIKPVVALH